MKGKVHSVVVLEATNILIVVKGIQGACVGPMLTLEILQVFRGQPQIGGREQIRDRVTVEAFQLIVETQEIGAVCNLDGVQVVPSACLDHVLQLKKPGCYVQHVFASHRAGHHIGYAVNTGVAHPVQPVEIHPVVVVLGDDSTSCGQVTKCKVPTSIGVPPIAIKLALVVSVQSAAWQTREALAVLVARVTERQRTAGPASTSFRGPESVVVKVGVARIVVVASAICIIF